MLQIWNYFPWIFIEMTIDDPLWLISKHHIYKCFIYIQCFKIIATFQEFSWKFFIVIKQLFLWVRPEQFPSPQWGWGRNPSQLCMFLLYTPTPVFWGNTPGLPFELLPSPLTARHNRCLNEDLRQNEWVWNYSTAHLNVQSTVLWLSLSSWPLKLEMSEGWSV